LSYERILISTNNFKWEYLEELPDPYGFIYITTNLIDGKLYIGQKKFVKYKWKNYLGSGTYLKNAIKKYGKENFHRDIVFIAFSKEELDDEEEKLIEIHDAVDRKDYYNQVEGGDLHEKRMKDKLIKDYFILPPSIDDYEWELMKECDPNLSDQ